MVSATFFSIQTITIMIGNQFKYGFVDLSWILSRNSFAIAGRNETYNAGDIIKMTIQSLNKFSRDLGLSVDKMIFFRDTWDQEVQGYYRASMIRQAGGAEYKGSRVYVTEDMLEDIKSDPNSTEEDIKKAEKEYYFNKTKSEAKWALIGELGRLGIPTVSIYGWEFDDLATLASFMLSDQDKPNVIITKDSDLIYSTSPGCYLWQPPLSKSPHKLTSYSEAYANFLPDRFKGRISLYDYFSMQQATGAIGHNDMNRTIKEGVNPDDAIEQAMNNNFSNFTNKELFITQYKTFNLQSFPRFDQACREITENLSVIGKLGSLSDFHEFCDKHNIKGISDRYYSEFINRFDSKLFSER
jgi:hypothetical protein